LHLVWMLTYREKFPGLAMLQWDDDFNGEDCLRHTLFPENSILVSQVSKLMTW
jgi:hypothetical protein